jgi:hypothetical protein
MAHRLKDGGQISQTEIVRIAEHKSALLQDQVDVQQDKIIQLEGQIEGFLS